MLVLGASPLPFRAVVRAFVATSPARHTPMCSPVQMRLASRDCITNDPCCCCALAALLPLLLPAPVSSPTELFASSFPTVVLYILDTPRCTAPQSFMSNMLQAVSILYKTKLPMLLVSQGAVISGRCLLCLARLVVGSCLTL